MVVGKPGQQGSTDEDEGRQAPDRQDLTGQLKDENRKLGSCSG